MKIYYAAGLKEIAKSSGFRGETLSSLERCSNFKRTNQFILQSWEALYRHTIKVFLTNQDSSRLHIEEVVKTYADKDCPGSMADFLPASDDFKEFCNTMSKMDETWQLWINFLFQDGLAYLGLYFAICNTQAFSFFLTRDLRHHHTLHHNTNHNNV